MPATTVPPPPAPSTKRRRLYWHRLIPGLWYRPVEILDEARDRTVWGAAILLCLVCGALGTVTKGSFRQQWDGNRQLALGSLATVEAGVLFATLVLGVVTHSIARHLGGNGRFGPTVTLFVVLFWTTDLPRLALHAWLPAHSVAVRAVAGLTWLFGYALAALLIRGQHHLPTHKALASVSIQMLAAGALLKFPPGH
ncbi:YIP1 family protein [Streptomyces varsoviensis]|uniref:YIP1 family protein n=1 Tax=Streptomyces varsoviensis TaxID=67373 RepID=UPI0004C96E15|nr:YIP1 family protein [Streptomyces varsoviensis]